MAYNFIECNREQGYLLPPDLREWLSEGDLVWFIIDAVEQMDLSKIYSKHRIDGWGRASYNPRMMTSLLLYAYCLGERSSRKIERLCERDIGFKVITANKAPDHSSISRFRQSNEEDVGKIFIEVLRLCGEAGLLKVGVVAIDGTKIKGNTSLSSNRTINHIEDEVKKILKEAEIKDEEEDKLYGREKRGDELPEGLRDRRSRLSRLKECKERLDREAAGKEAKQKAKIEARELEETETGKKKRGRKPMLPEEVINKEAKANVTDPESRIMKTRTGYEQGYNAQAVVTEGQIIVAVEVTQEENDVRQLNPMLGKAKDNIESAGLEARIKVGLADAGYWSENNINESASDGPELIIATKKDWKQKKAMKEQQPPRGRIPDNLSERQLMERKTLTKRGRSLYKKRGYIVEGVFGQIKGARRINQFLRRGLTACKSEWKLICASHNLLKLFNSGRVCLA